MNKLFIILTVFLTLSLSANEVSLFDGKTLKGWRPVKAQNLKYWSVVDGVITASNGNEKMPTNTYIATDKNYQNFIFKCKFRLSGDHKTGLINSGIQYRSIMKKTKVPGDHHIVGYQADIGKGYWGDIYDEHRRGLLKKANTKELFKNFKEDAWNDYVIHCEGSRHRLYINGKLTVDYIEANKNVEDFGVIALQLHSGGVAKMEYKDITIKELPSSHMSLPLSLTAAVAKINGKGLRYQKNLDWIVSWNKINDFLEWPVPAGMTPGKYKVTLNYACDTNRQGSDCVLFTQSQKIPFKTQSKHKKWQLGTYSIGVIDLKAGDKSFRLKCNKLKADWCMDFSSIEFEKL